MITAQLVEASRVGPLFTEQNEHLEELRSALVRFGGKLDLFSGWICHCGADDCPARAPEYFPAEQLMAAILTYYNPGENPDQLAADAEGLETEAARFALVEFGTYFDLFECPCGDDNCRSKEGPTLPFYSLLELVWEVWVVRSGYFLRMPTVQEADNAELFKMRNLEMIKLFTERLLTSSMTRWKEMLERYRELHGTAWHQECKHLNDKGRETWMQYVKYNGEEVGVANHPIIMRAHYVLMALPERAGFSLRDMRDTILSLSDAIHALQMLNIADPDITRALYTAVEPMIPIAELKMQLITGKVNPLA